MRSLRSQRVLLAIAMLSAVSLGAAQLVALPSGAATADIVAAAVSGAEISPFFIGLGASLFTSADLSSRQFALTLLQLNNRAVVFGAKTVVLVIAALLTGTGAVALVVPLAIVVSGSSAASSTTSWLVLPVLHVLFALLGAAIGMIMRSVVTAVFAYLAVVWALPLVVAVAGIWAPALSGALLQFAPVTLTAAMLESSVASSVSAVARFGAVDCVLLVVGILRVFSWRIR